jgi:hypothetical protein
VLADARTELELPGGGARLRRLLDAASRPVSSRLSLAALGTLAAASIAVRIAFGLQVKGPFFFMDELGYERMAASIAHHGTIALFGKTGLAYSPLYPLLLSPIYALTSSAQTAYDAVKVVNAVLLSLSVFPLYAIARTVLPRPRALGVAALSLIAPLMFYSGLELSESLAYPLFLVAIWAMLRATSAPSVRNDALLLGAILLAAAARLQQIALIPAALTAIIAVALVRRNVRQALAAHRLLFGATALGGVAVIARTITNGGALPLAGRYSEVGQARANPLHVLEIAAQHVAELDFAVGIVPFAAALLAGYAVVRFGFPQRQTVFAAVATSAALWLVLEVAFDAAAFDDPHKPSALPRIHERYLIYLIPLFLVALVAALRATRARVGSRAHLAVAAAAVALPAAIPFAHVINYTIPVESFGLQVFGTNRHGTIAAVHDALLVAVCIAAFFGLGYLYALLRPRPSFAIILTVIVFLMLSSLVRLRIIGAAQTTYTSVSTHAAWIDRAAGSQDVALVSGRLTLHRRAALLDTAFRNLGIAHVYYACKPVFGASFGESRLAGAVRTPYAVVPDDVRVPGRVLAREAKEHLELVVPTGGVLRFPTDHRRVCGR